jgi:hypothetical protein
MANDVKVISVKGKRRAVEAISVAPASTVIFSGRYLTVGVIDDEFWIEASALPTPTDVIDALRRHPSRPDLFSFTQKLPNVAPQYGYHRERESLAVARFESYSEWFETQVNRSVRKHLRKAAREGIVAKIVPFDNELIGGIHQIYNELPIRQGRRFWHYGKEPDVIKAENASYLDRSVFIGAFLNGELTGFLKMVVDGEVASIMQILSKSVHYERRPTNALIGRAVEVCETMRIRYLTYGNYIYGKKNEGTLVDFKRNNGFMPLDVPRYYVPLTLKGQIALRLELHKGTRELIPELIERYALKVRAKWHSMRQRVSTERIGSSD